MRKVDPKVEEAIETLNMKDGERSHQPAPGRAGPQELQIARLAAVLSTSSAPQ